jgi:serine protease
VFPGARILPIKVCCVGSDGNQTDSTLLRQGILYAAGIPNDYGHASPERARVINISYVLSARYDLGVLDAITQATQAGSIVITALGEGTPHVSEYLAQIPGVVGVITASDGSSRPLAGLPIPVIPAPGTGILALMPGGTALAPIPSIGSTSGSSFATAVASAVAAMVFAANPNLSPADVATILSSGAVYDAQGLDALLAVQKADELPLPPGSTDGSANSSASGGALDGRALWVLSALTLFGMWLRRGRIN